MQSVRRNYNQRIRIRREADRRSMHPMRMHSIYKRLSGATPPPAHNTVREKTHANLDMTGMRIEKQSHIAISSFSHVSRLCMFHPMITPLPRLACSGITQPAHDSHLTVMTRFTIVGCTPSSSCHLGAACPSMCPPVCDQQFQKPHVFPVSELVGTGLCD